MTRWIPGRGRRRPPLGAAVVLLVAALVYAGLEGGGGTDGAGTSGRGDRPAVSAERELPATGRRRDAVERVVDGDTVVLAGIGKARLIGVDTPEVYGGVECYGREASAFAKRVLPPGARVRYSWGAERRDRYGRALVYLWLRDGRFFNEMLVRHGYAQPLTITPNVRFSVRFRRLARMARERGRGLWDGSRCPRDRNTR